MPHRPEMHEPAPSDELVPQDDAIIARAVRLSLYLLAIAAAVALVLVLVSRSRRSKPANMPAPASASVASEIPTIQPPPVIFTDITSPAGLHFVHNSGATGEKLLPETMGGGVAFLDYDNDGKPDLLFINTAGPPALYHNDGGGHFTDVTAGSGLDQGSIRGMGVAVGDYDNDGRADFLITGVGGCRLFHNEGGGHFRDVTAEAGVGGSPADWSTSAAFVDYDNDGRLDLFVCNYVRWSREIDLKANYTLNGIGRAFGPPTGFEGAFCRLYHNDGNGHFSDVSARAGIQVRNKDTGVAIGKSLGVLPIDIDGDGFIDFLVANDTVQNFLFHNNRDGTFEEIAIPCGLAFDTNGAARGGMGIDAAWFANDNSLGIAVGNFANEMMAFYAGTPGGPAGLHFTDDAISYGLGGPTRLPLKFGIVFFDYDLDGWPDLLCANGHIEPEISKLVPGETYRQPAQLFWNAAGKGGGFIPVTAAQSGPGLFKPIVGRGCAIADIDGDGDLDVVLTQIDGPPLLLRNDQHTGHHFLRLKLVGTTCNRDAIGAQVLVHLGHRTIRQQVMPTRGYLSQSELPVTVGLENALRPDSVEIIWPGGGVQRVNDYKVDALMEVRQDRGKGEEIHPRMNTN
ncbi:MAG TPA: CRTAC1 family protein [Tepidisphaeraceae bacterium]|nr:CRTAC1 family protein [Tepidisphaeraceae bacterium]